MESLAEQYRELHANPKRFHGYSIKRHLGELVDLVVSTNAKNLLDYGCGKGFQYLVRRYHILWGGILPNCYDPGVVGMDEKPQGLFDGVICNDVLEHVPEDEIDATLDTVFGYARKFVFLGVSTSASHKKLPDGRDCHITVRDRNWWRAKVDAASNRCVMDVCVKLVFTEGEE